ncbi:MAG: InlB B-repeat-containing protein, partial [Clostridia bacterium]|nr:InlB B-repeat-containing protein [Clostridia bacterium]
MKTMTNKLFPVALCVVLVLALAMASWATTTTFTRADLIYTIDLTGYDFATPHDGDSSPTTLGAQDDPIVVNDNNGHYQFYVTWESLDEGYSDMDGADFEAGVTYYATFHFQALNGNTFWNGERWGTYNNQSLGKVIVDPEDNTRATISRVEFTCPYVITFLSNTVRNETDSMEVMPEANFQLPICSFTAPTGAKFKCWVINGFQYDPSKGNTYGYIWDQNLEATALWVEDDSVPVTVSFYAGEGGQGEMAEVHTTAGNYTLPECEFTHPTKTFRAWLLGGNEYQPGYVAFVPGDISLTALWQDSQITVSFAAGEDGEGEMEDVLMAPGDFELPECEFDHSDLYFRCWSVNGIEHQPGDVIELEHNVTVTAMWGHLISFSPSEGEGEMDGVIVADGATYVAPECAFTAPEDNEFDYWRVVPGGAHLDPGDELEVDDDYVLVAIWKDIQGVIYEWVFFNGNGGEGEMDGEQVRNGDSYELPECEFTYEGYVFTGWDVNDESYAVGDT